MLGVGKTLGMGQKRPDTFFLSSCTEHQGRNSAKQLSPQELVTDRAEFVGRTGGRSFSKKAESFEEVSVPKTIALAWERY